MSSKKYICPKCGKKRFVLYLDDDKVPAGDEFGRCDRVSSCGYHQYPNSSKPPKPVPKPKRTLIIEPSIAEASIEHGGSTVFGNWIIRVFGEKGAEALKLYNVGASKKWYKGGLLPATVFWQRDFKGQFRTGKIMGYALNGVDCKRVKEPPQYTWVHRQIDFDETSFEMRQCLFGEHLLPEAQAVAVFESEKSAVFAHCLFAQNSKHITCVATGGKQQFKEQILAHLSGKEVVVCPDKGCLNDWRKAYSNFQYLFPKPQWLEPEDDLPDGADIVDQYLPRLSKK